MKLWKEAAFTILILFACDLFSQSDIYRTLEQYRKRSQQQRPTETIAVSVQGISDGARNSKRQDRDEAIMDAKLQAIEKAGVNIKSITEAENFVLKYDIVESKAEAVLLPGFQIIDVGYGADGLYHVVLTGKVRATGTPGGAITGTSFKTVRIGSQVWMAENLNVGHYRNGDPIPYVQDKEKWASLQYGAWCYYYNDPANGKIYGKLYNWYAVNDPRGLAPTGWHVPTDNEWQSLLDHLGGDKVAGEKLKSRSGWSENGNGTNSSGFNALPGGYRGRSGDFSSLGNYALFWSSSEYGSNGAWRRYLSYDGADVGRSSGRSKRGGFSVRLVRD